jgi:hypothetical protein
MKENMDEWWGHFCEALGDDLSVIKGEMCSWCGAEERLTPEEIKNKEGEELTLDELLDNSPQLKNKEGDDLLEIISNKGRKYDYEKPQLYLLPPKTLYEVGKVLTFGAEKYDPHNWRKVDDLQNRYSSAAMRHILAHIDGEDLDEETGLSHLAHAICCLMFKLEDELIAKSEEKSVRKSKHREYTESNKVIGSGKTDNEEGSMPDFEYLV